MFITSPRFPDDISYGSSGGPKYSTTVITLNSGHEQRNINWMYPIREYDVAYGVKDEADIEALIHWFHIAKGQAHTFRFKDWSDYKTCGIRSNPSAADQPLGSPVSGSSYQLIKTYNVGSNYFSVPITKPVAHTIKVAVGGVPTTSFSLDDTTGIITVAGGGVTWGGEFDIHCRFATDSFSVQLVTYQAGTASIPIIEVR